MFQLTGNINVNKLVTAKRNYKDYYIRYNLKSINETSKNKVKKENQIYEK